MNAETAYLFTHALLRDAAYQLQLPGVRAKLHLLAAELLEHLLFPNDATVAVEIAEHLRHAGDHLDLPGMAERERRFLELAAGQARDAYRHEDALRLTLRIAELVQGPARAEAYLAAADTCLNSGMLSRAAEAIEAASSELMRTKGELEIRALLHKADLCVRSGKSIDAESPARLAQQLAESGLMVELRVRALALLGICLQDTGRSTEAREVYSQALELARSTDNRRLLQQCTANLGAMHHELGEYHEAARLYYEALELAAGRGDARVECVLLSNLASLGRRLFDADRIERDYARALELAVRIGERRQEGITLGNYAMQQHEWQNFGRAEELYARAQAIAREVGNRRSEAIMTSSLAALHQDLGRYAKALPLTLQAVELLTRLGEKRALCTALGNLAALHADLGNPVQAEQTFQRALEVARAASNERMEGLQLCSFAKFLVLQRREQEAREAWRKGAALLRKLQDLVSLKHKAESLRAGLDKVNLAHWTELQSC